MSDPDCEVIKLVRQAREAGLEGNSALVFEILDQLIPRLEAELNAEKDLGLRILLAEMVAMLVALGARMINRELMKIVPAA